MAIWFHWSRCRLNQGIQSLLKLILNHWGRVTHICVGNLTIIGPDNGLSPGRRQAIIWTNAGILLIGPWGTNFSEILIGIQAFSFKEMHLKMSSAKWCQFCLGLNVLTPTCSGVFQCCCNRRSCGACSYRAGLCTGDYFWWKESEPCFDIEHDWHREVMKQKETAIEDYVLPKFDVDCHMPRFDCDVIYVSIVKTMFVFDKSCYEGKFQLSFKFNSLTL